MSDHAQAENLPESEQPTLIERVICAAGGLSPLARKIGIKPPSVHEWKVRGQVPGNRVLAVEAVTGISRHELRPDIYGESPTGVVRSAVGAAAPDELRGDDFSESPARAEAA